MDGTPPAGGLPILQTVWCLVENGYHDYAKGRIVMKTILRAFVSLGLAIMVFGCAGAHYARRPLYFERPPKGDTADFIHVTIKDKPFSIEVLGKSDSLNENFYRIQLQFTIYGAPGFDYQSLVLRPESISVGINDVQFRSAYCSPLRTEVGSYHAYYLCIFGSDKNLLLAELGNADVLQMGIRFDGFIEYGGHPVIIEPIIMLDPWLKRLAAASSKANK